MSDNWELKIFTKKDSDGDWWAWLEAPDLPDMGAFATSEKRAIRKVVRRARMLRKETNRAYSVLAPETGASR